MDVFKVVGSFFIKNDEANNSIDETTNKAESASGKIGKAFSTIAQGVAVGVGACATAIGAMGKQALEAYADYEQLVGGIETMFEDLSWDVGEYAKEAYKTAGLSMNEYMETVMGFSASLNQSLLASEGNIARSADLSNQIIIDMADNANKMGSSMESIQNAYSGFAKQNYTMLDNLKLGYGGTKEEMERLIADANKVREANGEMANLTIDSFADVATAINIIQTEMGITGTTALEASTTISGSMASLKSAWSNVLIAMGDDEADFSATINNLVESATTVVGNVLPRIKIIAQAVPELVTQLAPQIPAIVESIFPALLQGAMGLFTSLVAQIPALIGIVLSAVSAQTPTMLATIGDLLVGMAEFIQTNLPIFTEKATDMMNGLGQKIKENLPDVISKGLDILLGLSETILNNLPTLVASGMDLIMSLVQGIIASLPDLIAKAPQIVINFANSISNSMQTIFMKGAEIIWELIKGIIGVIPNLKENFSKIVEAIFAVWNAINWLNLGKNLMNGIKNGLQNVAGSLKDTASKIFGNLKDSILKPIQTAKTTIKGIVDSIKGFFSGMKISFPSIPMPHFTVSPSGWKIADLLKGSIPSLGVSWYAKAMDNPMMFTRPTLFDVNPVTGQARGAGEAGDEVMIGKNTMLNMIQEAVAQETGLMMASVNDVLNRIFDLLSEYVPEMAHTQMVLDTGVMVGELAPAMDTALGAVYRKRKRGV